MGENPPPAFMFYSPEVSRRPLYFAVGRPARCISSSGTLIKTPLNLVSGSRGESTNDAVTCRLMGNYWSILHPTFADQLGLGLRLAVPLFFTALALWPKGDCLGRRWTIRLKHAVAVEPFQPRNGSQHRTFQFRNGSQLVHAENGLEALEDDPIWSTRLQRDRLDVNGRLRPNKERSRSEGPL